MLTHITANRNQIIRGQKHFGFHHLEYIRWRLTLPITQNILVIYNASMRHKRCGERLLELLCCCERDKYAVLPLQFGLYSFVFCLAGRRTNSHVWKQHRICWLHGITVVILIIKENTGFKFRVIITYAIEMYAAWRDKCYESIATTTAHTHTHEREIIISSVNWIILRFCHCLDKWIK